MFSPTLRFAPAFEISLSQDCTAFRHCLEIISPDPSLVQIPELEDF